MTPNEFILWLNGYLDAISEAENYHISRIKSKLKEITPNDIPFKYHEQSQYAKSSGTDKQILKG